MISCLNSQISLCQYKATEKPVTPSYNKVYTVEICVTI